MLKKIRKVEFMGTSGIEFGNVTIMNLNRWTNEKLKSCCKGIPPWKIWFNNWIFGNRTKYGRCKIWILVCGFEIMV